jgi:hypothetical protein
MEIITMESNAYKLLIQKLDDVHAELKKLQDPAKELSREWVDAYDVMNMLHISRRTLSKYLQSGKLQYSKIQNKNYFRLKDIEEFLMQNHRSRARINNNQHGA